MAYKSVEKRNKYYLERYHRLKHDKLWMENRNKLKLKWYHTHKNKILNSQGFRENRRVYESSRREEFRNKLLNALGNKCVWCGYDNPKALCFDHINGDGYLSRNSTRSCTKYYVERLNNLEKTKQELQILCANCNMIKAKDNHEYSGRKNKNKGVR